MNPRRDCRNLLLLSVLLAACDAQDQQNLIVGQLESDRVELTAEFAGPIVARGVAEGDTVLCRTVGVHHMVDREVSAGLAFDAEHGDRQRTVCVRIGERACEIGLCLEVDPVVALADDPADGLSDRAGESVPDRCEHECCDDTGDDDERPQIFGSGCAIVGPEPAEFPPHGYSR